MSLSYTLKESLSGFTRAKLSTFASVVTITISLLLLGVFAVITINASRFIDALRDKVEMEAFLEEPLGQDSLARIIQSTLEIEGVDRVIVVSKEEAARFFKEQFGEDIMSVLDFNPLPPSLKVFLRPDHRTADKANAVHDQLRALRGVESVIYRKALLEFIDQRTATAYTITLGLGILISLSAIFLVSNTIRLAIYAKRRILRTMELVGATRSFMRLPFLLEGILQGLLGGIVAALLLYCILEYGLALVLAEIAQQAHMEAPFYAGVAAAGIALGLIGSVISVIRFIKVAGAV